MIARNRTNRGDDDLVLSHIDELNIDQLWLMAVDVGDGLTTADAFAIQRFRENGGGVRFQGRAQPRAPPFGSGLLHPHRVRGPVQTYPPPLDL